MPAPDTAPRVILAQALTHEAFAAYGVLIAPGPTERDINFGTISSSGPPRNIQFGLKYNF